MTFPPVRKCALLGGVAMAAICGAAVTASGSPAVGAFVGVLGWLASVAANQTNDFLNSVLEDPPEAEPIFRNNHVRALLALAVRVVAERVAARLKAQHGEISKGLLDAPAKLQQRFGAELDQPGSPFAQLGEFQVTEVLNEFVHSQGDVNLLAPDDWDRFVDEARLDVSELEREALVSALHHRELGKAIWGIVKDDAQKGGQGFAAIELLYLSKILSAVEQQPTETRPDVTPMLERINVLFERADERTRKSLAPLLTDVAAVRTTLREFYGSYREDRQQDAAFHAEVRADLRSTKRQIRREARYVVDEVISHIDERNDAERREREQQPQPPPLPNRRRALQPARPSLWARLFGWGRDKTKNRRRMLALVRTYQIEGILHEAIRETNQIQVDWKLAPDAVVKHADLDGLLVSTGTSFEKIFERLVDRPVLILGAPGSGKSILLLQLTEVLLKAAERDSSRPIPVMLNLSSWATARLPLEEWLIHESHLSYLVPERLMRRWCEENMICPLLDGLDEVAPEHRRACLDAIELWRIQHPARAMAICSRTGDYEALHAKFTLPTAIELLPLSDEQLDPVLARESLAGLRALLQKEAWFRDDLRTVLFLSFAAFAYAEMEEATLRLPTEADETSQRKARLKHLYDSYVTRRFAQSNLEWQIPESKLRRFLGWLAHQMESREHTRFHLENLQMNWISTGSGRCWFAFLSQFVFGLVVLLPLAMVSQLIAATDVQSVPQTSTRIGIVIWTAFATIEIGILAGIFSLLRHWVDLAQGLKWRERLRQGALVVMSLICLQATIVGIFLWIGTPHVLALWQSLALAAPPNDPTIQMLSQSLGELDFPSLAARIAYAGQIALLNVVTIMLTIIILPRRIRNRQVACFALCAFTMNAVAHTYNMWEESLNVWNKIATVFTAIFYGVMATIPAAYFGMLDAKVTVGATKWRISLRALVGFAVPLLIVLLPFLALSQQIRESRVDWSTLWIAMTLAAGGGLLGGTIAGIQRTQGALTGGELHTARPNEAVINALRGAFGFMLVTVIAISLIVSVFVLSGVPLYAPRPGVPYSLGEKVRGVMCFSLMVGCVLAVFSGIDIPVKHYVLRGVLWFVDRVPLRLTHPLIAGCQKSLLRSAGGGFEFSHRTLREHFARTECASRSRRALGRIFWVKTRWGTLCVLILLLLPIVWHPIIQGLDPAHRLTTRANSLWSQKKFAEAEKKYRQALEINKSRHGKNHHLTAASNALVGEALYRQGHYSEADEFLREALATARQTLLPNDPFFAEILNFFTWNVEGWADESQSPELYAEAKAGYREIIQRTKDKYVIPFPATAKPMNRLIQLLVAEGELFEAEQLTREFVDLQKAVRKAPHVDTAEAKRTLAACLALQERYDEAKPIVEEALDEALKSAGKNSATTARSYYWLARIQEGKGEATQALVNAEQALTLSKSTFRADDRRLKEAQDLVARLQR